MSSDDVCTCTTFGHCAICRPRNDRRPTVESDLSRLWSIPCTIALTPESIFDSEVVLVGANVQPGDARVTLLRLLDALRASLVEA